MRAPAEFLAERIEAREIPSASFVVGDAGNILARGAMGDAVVLPSRAPADEETIYDLASLTKPLVTSALALILSREEGFRLSDPAARFLPAFERLDKREITLTHLLTHTSGLPGWIPLYLSGGSVGEYLAQIREIAPESRPGAAVRYSDPGYIALGAILERIGGASLDRLAGAFIFDRVGARACFRPDSVLRRRVAATEEACNYERAMVGSLGGSYRGWRDGIIQGEVHDQNSFAAGGVTGHAGLFGTAVDVYLVARECLSPEPRLYREEEMPLLRESMTGALAEPRSLAYRINRDAEGRSDPATAAGEALSPATFGHNGFTGTSVWIDPTLGRVFVLLTNRVHPRVREDLDMNVLRREFHRLAARV